VVGASCSATGEAHAFLWEKGKMRDLGTLAGASYIDPRLINERGQVAGVIWTDLWEPRAFLWEKGTMTALGTLGGTYSSLSAINNRGQIVGNNGTDPADCERELGRAVLWTK
jgi:probable HAF family extracellular repeat protein